MRTVTVAAFFAGGFAAMRGLGGSARGAVPVATRGFIGVLRGAAAAFSVVTI